MTLGTCTRVLMAALSALMFATNAIAQAPAELEQLVGRIALYPDDLVAIILPAATNPMQLVQAERYLEKRKANPKLPMDEKWDDAVKSLLNYPEVVKSMSTDLDWTSALGEAVVANHGAVLEAIQVFRRKTQAAGNLKTDAKQKVVVEKEVIKIVPADPQVIYVPQYNPATVVVVGGYSSWGYYPSPYPVYYYPYPPGAAMATGLVWGAAMGAAWNGNHYSASYSGGGNTINVNNSTNVNVNQANVNQAKTSASQSGAASQQTSGSSSQWQSNKQSGQVSSSTGTAQSARVGSASSAGTASASTQSSGGAFGGANSSGHQAQMDSSRGASSLGGSSSISGQGARQVPPSGGAGRASMGGGRSGGGAGGGSRSGGGGGRR